MKTILMTRTSRGSQNGTKVDSFKEEKVYRVCDELAESFVAQIKCASYISNKEYRAKFVPEKIVGDQEDFDQENLVQKSPPDDELETNVVKDIETPEKKVKKETTDIKGDEIESSKTPKMRKSKGKKGGKAKSVSKTTSKWPMRSQREDSEEKGLSDGL